MTPQPATRASTSAGPAIPPGRVLFAGDFSSHDLSQWDACQTVGTNAGCGNTATIGNSIVVDADALGPDVPAARFTVHPGDVPEFGGGERAELRADGEGALTHEGDERWYRWTMFLPETFPTPTGGWFIVVQWHAGFGSPPLAINISDHDTVDVGGDGVDHPVRTLGPVRRGEWVNYTLHVRFSRNAATGYVEGWENDTHTVSMTRRATMSSDENSVKQGIYRDGDAGDGTAEVWLAGFRVVAP